MKVNSAGLYDLINQKNIKPNTKINVYLDDIYKTQIIYDGECFNWTSGTFDSSYFFNPLVDFEIMEKDEKIEKLERVRGSDLIDLHSNSTPIEQSNAVTRLIMYLNNQINKINELIDKMNEFMEVNNESK